MSLHTPETIDADDCSRPAGDSQPSDGSRRRLRPRLLSPRVMWSMSDQVFVSGMSFGTSILVGRIDATSLGVYALAMTLVHFFRGIQGELVTAPFTVYSQHRAGKALEAYTGSVLAHQLIFSLIGLLLVIGVDGAMWWLGAPPYLHTTLAVMLIAMPALLWHSFVRHYCFARLRFGRAAMIDGTVATVQLTCLAWLVWTGQLTVNRCFLVMGAAASAGVMMWGLTCRDTFQFRRASIKSDWDGNWLFSRWALASQLIGCSTPYVLPWAISFTRGEYDTGRFAACVTTVGLSAVFITAMGNLLTPVSARHYAQGGPSKLLRVLFRAILGFMSIVGLFFVFVLITGDFLVVWFYGTNYAGTGLICQCLAAGVLFNCISVVAGNGLWAIDKPGWNLPADIVTLGVTTVAAALLIPSQGIVGAAISTVAGLAAGAAIRSLTFFVVLPKSKPYPQRCVASDSAL